jgi:DNA-binding GntR family transcriptional regulator
MASPGRPTGGEHRGSGKPDGQGVLNRIRKAILGAELSPGQRLVESDLAARFEASRSHVRSALLTLANEGLVDQSRYRGAMVRQVSVREATEITEVRMALEGLCSAKAAQLATDEDREELVRLGEQMRVAVDDGQLVAYSDLNRRLHACIRRLSGHRTAVAMLERLRGQTGVTHQYRLATLPGRPAASLPEHLAIIEAIAARDPDAAETAMRRHLASVMEALRMAGMADSPAGLLAVECTADA